MLDAILMDRIDNGTQRRSPFFNSNPRLYTERNMHRNLFTTFVLTAALMGLGDTMQLNTVAAQDFESIERRLGDIVADGDLSLEQAHVMLDALRHWRQRRDRDERLLGDLNRIGISPSAVDGVRRTLMSNGLDDDRSSAVMQMLANVIEKFDGEPEEFSLPTEMVEQLSERAGIREPQLNTIEQIGKRLVNQVRTNPTRRSESKASTEPSGGSMGGFSATDKQDVVKKMIDWIHSTEAELRKAVDDDVLDEATAMKKWDWFKAKAIGPKLKAAVDSGIITADAADRIWTDIKKGEADRRD